MPGAFDRADRAAPPGRHPLRRPRRRRRHHRRRRGRSTPPSRGLRTALVERDDFASGTSSKSSKLVHGGLRYLQQGDVRLVYEALAERQRLRKNAPHLVKVLPFLLPVFGKDGVIPKKLARALGSAMWMYDLTGGARIGKLHKRLSPERGPGPHADAAGRQAGVELPLLRRPGRRRPPDAHPGPHRGHRLRRRGRQRHPRRRAAARTTAAGPSARGSRPPTSTVASR